MSAAVSGICCRLCCFFCRQFQDQFGFYKSRFQNDCILIYLQHTAIKRLLVSVTVHR